MYVLSFLAESFDAFAANIVSTNFTTYIYSKGCHPQCPV